MTFFLTTNKHQIIIIIIILGNNDKILLLLLFPVPHDFVGEVIFLKKYFNFLCIFEWMDRSDKTMRFIHLVFTFAENSCIIMEA